MDREPIDLSHFYSGGYFLIREGHPGWEQLKGPLLPDTLISLSPCIATHFQLHWGWNPGNKAKAKEFGIPHSRWDAFVDWCNKAHGVEISWASMFYSPEAARRFINQFVPDVTGLHLIGVGLAKEMEQQYWQEPLEPGQVLCGVEEQIEKHLLLEEGGHILGFDMVGLAYCDFDHSWLCHYLHLEVYEAFSIRPGIYGLIQTEQEARQVCEWVNANAPDHAPYDYWLLVDYPLVNS
jgi:hypothetical protein